MRYLTDAVAAWIDEERHPSRGCRYRLEWSNGRVMVDLGPEDLRRLLPRLEGNWRIVSTEASCLTSDGDASVDESA